MKPSQSHIHTIRNLRYHVRTWGDSAAPKMFLLHGWMDVSASFQFLVDCFQREWYVVAPDWRGFGLTEWAAGGYWFPDYYADLDALLEIYQPDMPVNLVAHSMGGNVACTYAGIRPQRVARLVSLEGFGMGRTAPDQAAGRYRQWLDELREPPRFNSYTSFDAVAARLKKNNRRLTDEQAHFLAQHWAKQTGPAEVTLRSDPKHKFVNPVLTRLEELLACWRQVTAPVLWVAGDETNGRGWRTDSVQQLAERKAAFRDFREIELPDCGHMMHHDQPEKLAAIIEEFLARP
ncbi:MAG: alpha/beta hydrolase [Betaproteobacteria bacterium]|nr:alpha/beta hydrolase [Betaproteobacteria bacterium]